MVPTVGVLFWKKATTAGAFSGMLVGIIMIVLFTFTPLTAPGAFANGGATLLALISNIVVFITVSTVSKPRPQKLMDELKQQYADFYHGVNFE